MKTSIEVISQLPTSGDRIRLHPLGARLEGVPTEEFQGKKRSTVLTRDGKNRIWNVGIGDSAKMSDSLAREAVGAGVKGLLAVGADRIVVEVNLFSDHLQAMVEGALLAAYQYTDFLPEDRKRKNSLKQIRLVVRSKDLVRARAAAKTAQILAEATNFTRQLGNRPGNDLTPARLAEEAKRIARENRLTCKVWDEKALKREGFGGILAVGNGSCHPPRLMALEYRGGKAKQAPIVLIGKAITFDSGGISIKPGDRMDEMKFDKMGGCAVLGILQAAAQLKLPINLVGLVTSAENMPSATAYRPGDLVRTYDGKTIEVLNTDAEGRIVLVDAIAYARKHYRPELMIDYATLTGAIIVALGGKRAGLFATEDRLRDAFVEAGEATGDWVWPMPLGEEYDEQIRSDVALVKNTGGREGGACTAAAFIKAWVEKVPWVHLDIAGTAWTTKSGASLEKGATGFGVRLTIDALRRLKKI